MKMATNKEMTEFIKSFRKEAVRTHRNERKKAMDTKKDIRTTRAF